MTEIDRILRKYHGVAYDRENVADLTKSLYVIAENHRNTNPNDPIFKQEHRVIMRAFNKYSKGVQVEQ